ncbi:MULTISPECIES: DUF3089 domain-containing protein [unclassified Lentimicrobium]|uniref:DUF3089 domain-containing protein n=1 Tax=unclassified Lentimicrobium TaxID=2677434 RepID=UPI00155620AC|nr:MULTISPECIES: DUF3089 domain-containing protein [unclassified Lentimicrobium]NPD45035.1 DUF3089 domain-containing protein [Lentimicrobium sp. S6]NPD86056.1 DUF3089 domain-containing protein [Lentimicrobium sp. L6]
MKSFSTKSSKSILALSILLSILYNSNAQETCVYEQDKNWIVKAEQKLQYQADVFYIYPTVYFSSTPDNMKLNDVELREKAKGVYLEQASVFFNSANMFAPYYPQMSIACLTLPKEEHDKYYSIAYSEIKKALLYYLKNLNHGRPFILAGHSQGSILGIDLMKELFNDQELQEQLIAAYLIGYSITAEDLANYPQLKIAQGETDNGVIITYNTQAPNTTGSPVLLATAACVNPLTWTTDNSLAPSSKNLGAVFFDTNHKALPDQVEYTNAQIDLSTGALVVSTPNPDDFYTEGKSFFPKGVYHANDYQFFYRNLEKNAQKRIKAYFLKKQRRKQ